MVVLYVGEARRFMFVQYGGWGIKICFVLYVGEAGRFMFAFHEGEAEDLCVCNITVRWGDSSLCYRRVRRKINVCVICGEDGKIHVCATWGLAGKFHVPTVGWWGGKIHVCAVCDGGAKIYVLCCLRGNLGSGAARTIVCDQVVLCLFVFVVLLIKAMEL